LTDEMTKLQALLEKSPDAEELPLAHPAPPLARDDPERRRQLRNGFVGIVCWRISRSRTWRISLTLSFCQSRRLPRNPMAGSVTSPNENEKNRSSRITI
jgi:hypothetical protein